MSRLNDLEAQSLRPRLVRATNEITRLVRELDGWSIQLPEDSRERRALYDCSSELERQVGTLNEMIATLPAPSESSTPESPGVLP